MAHLRRTRPRAFAHHPDHPAFAEHVWTWRGLPMCKGCTMGLAGMVVGVPVAVATGWTARIPDWQLGLAFAAMLLPTVATSLLGAPRPVKLVARFVLGVLLGSAVVALFATSSWAVRAGTVGAYLAVRVPLERKRRRDDRKAMERWNVRGAG